MERFHKWATPAALLLLAVLMAPISWRALTGYGRGYGPWGMGMNRPWHQGKPWMRWQDCPNLRDQVPDSKTTPSSEAP